MPAPPATGQPVYIMGEGTQRTHGRSTQENNILAACAIADVVRTTLGPRGMDKMLVDASADTHRMRAKQVMIDLKAKGVLDEDAGSPAKWRKR
jgi:chaperonin GroEL (HSP60 family)